MNAIIASSDTGLYDAGIMAEFFDHEALRQFISDQMKRRNNMSQHDFAKLIGVSQPTIQRAITFENGTPRVPTLEFLVKLAKNTGTDLATLINLVVPGSSTIDGRTTILMSEIAKLPERQRESAEVLLRGLLLEVGKQE